MMGFSLAEVLISVLILAVLSVVLVGVIPSAMIGMKKAENRAKAACLARGALEILRKEGFDNIKPGVDVSTVLRDQAKADTQTWTHTDFTIAVASGPVYMGGRLLSDKKAKDVNVTVSWKDKQGDNSYSARTIFYKD
jgi:uncharacterized protein (TIGR02598 family)